MVTEIIASDRDFLEEALSLAQGAAFFFVLHEEGIARDLQMQNLQQALEAQGRPVHKVRFDLTSPDLLTMLSRLPLRPSTIVFVDVRGVEYAKFNPENYPEGVELRQKAQNARQMLSNLNLQRDQLTAPGVSLVFWVSEQALSQIAQWAADLFSARSGIFDLRPFVGPRPFISERSESMLYGSHLQELLRAVQELPPEERQKRKQTYERRLREESSKPVPHLARMASLHHELALLSLSLGETAKALSHQEAAVALYRKLAENGDPDALQISGKSLNEFGLILASLGQREAALQATQEAVEIYRQLAAAQPQAFLPDLAMSLNNLGLRLSDLGQREAALQATQEAVEICRQLAAAQPQAFLPDLAGSLNNLGAMLSGLGQREAALQATQEAVELYRQLDAAQPQAFLPGLARSLGAHVSALLAAGQVRKAAAAFVEGLKLLLSLVRALPPRL